MTDEQTSNPESLVTSGPRGLTARSQGLVARGLDLLAKRVRAVERPADQSQDGRSVPNDPWSWFIRRNAYWWFENGYNAYWAKDWARAVYAYGEALRLEPDCVLACVGRGLVHRSEGQYAQAILNFQEALRLQPDAVVAWDALGEAYLRQGSTSQATEVYERLKILDPVRADSFLRNILHPGPEPPRCP